MYLGSVLIRLTLTANFKILTLNMYSWTGTMGQGGKGDCCQSWHPESDPLDTFGWTREWTSDLQICNEEHAHTHIHVHAHTSTWINKCNKCVVLSRIMNQWEEANAAWSRLQFCFTCFLISGRLWKKGRRELVLSVSSNQILLCKTCQVIRPKASRMDTCATLHRGRKRSFFFHENTVYHRSSS